MANKQIYVIGGGTISHVRTHLALCSPAYGTTAKRIAELCKDKFDKMDVNLILTKMADSNSKLETNEDIKNFIIKIVNDANTKIIFFNPALVDYDGEVNNIKSGKYSQRLSTHDINQKHLEMELTPADKVISYIRKEKRKDIFLVGFKTTSSATIKEQYEKGLNLLKTNSANLVLANDVITRKNMIIVPEESTYTITNNREDALTSIVDIAYMRSHLTFTRSTVVAGDPIPWNSDTVPSSLRTIVDYCIDKGAYKKFLGVTAGHFAAKIDSQTFITSRRKTDFNDIKNVGLVLVKTDGPDSVIAYGSKPSVGGQSQRIVFEDNPDMDCIVHFHCPIKKDSLVPTISQKEYECGSHQCGKNTSNGLKQFGNLKAVYLDNHGPNIVFNRNIDPNEVIKFIEDNFDLTLKTNGLE